MKYGALSSIPRETNINGQFHQLSYIRPDEAELLKSLGGAGTAGPGGVPQYGWLSDFFSGGSSSSSSSSSSNDDDDSGSGNSFSESLANIFTPNDGASYVNGQLVDDRTGDRIEAGGTTFSGNVISGSANTESNDGRPIPESFTNSLPALVENPNKDSYNETQTDEKWGYTRADGTVVTAAQDLIDGGGKNFGGEVFAISGGVNADLDGDGYVTAAEATASGNLNSNIVSNISNASGATPLGSGLDPTGVAGFVYDYTLPGMAYKGVKGATDNFGYGGRPDSSLNSDLDSVVGGLSGQNAINAAVNYAVEDESVPYPESPDEDTNQDEDTTPTFESGGRDPYSTDIYGTRDIYGDFYGGRSGGMWDRFAGSYLTRFGYSPEQFNEMIRKVENPDGTTSFFGADGQLINPESIGSNYRLAGDPTSLKIGEEQVKIGSENYDSSGNLLSTDYTDAYNPDIDILAQG